MAMCSGIYLAPQAGFANRLRLLTSGIVLGRLCGVNTYTCWEVEAPLDADLEHVRMMRYSTLGDFFEPNSLLKFCSATDAPRSLVYTEHLPGSYWYDKQSQAQRRLQGSLSNAPLDLKQLSLEHPQVLQQAPVLIESSLALPVDDALRALAYQHYFKPHEKYVRELDRLWPTEAKVLGVHVRRGDMLSYHSEVNYSVTQVRETIISDLQKCKSSLVLLVGDDRHFCASVETELSKSGANFLILTYEPSFSCKERMFLDWLALARCCVIRGTPHSSFAYEASLFGEGWVESYQEGYAL